MKRKEVYLPRAFLYLLEVASQCVAALVRGRIVHDGGRLACHCIFLFLTLRTGVFVVLSYRVILLSFLTSVYVIFQLNPHLSLGWLISGIPSNINK